MSATKITYHRDGSVTLWSVHMQQWIRTRRPSDEALASLSSDARGRVLRHIAKAA